LSYSGSLPLTPFLGSPPLTRHFPLLFSLPSFFFLRSSFLCSFPFKKVKFMFRLRQAEICYPFFSLCNPHGSHLASGLVCFSTCKAFRNCLLPLSPTPFLTEKGSPSRKSGPKSIIPHGITVLGFLGRCTLAFFSFKVPSYPPCVFFFLDAVPGRHFPWVFPVRFSRDGES